MIIGVLFYLVNHGLAFRELIPELSVIKATPASIKDTPYSSDLQLALKNIAGKSIPKIATHVAIIRLALYGFRKLSMTVCL